MNKRKTAWIVAIALSALVSAEVGGSQSSSLRRAPASGGDLGETPNGAQQVAAPRRPCSSDRLAIGSTTRAGSVALGSPTNLIATLRPGGSGRVTLYPMTANAPKTVTIRLAPTTLSELRARHAAAPLPQTVGSAATTILSDGFEGSFPGQWQVAYLGSSERTVSFGKSTCRVASGSYSLWCAGGGTNPQPLCGNYVANMDVAMTYGPFSLADVTDGTIDFDVWYNTEAGYDYSAVLISVDNKHFYGFGDSGNSGGWVHDTLNFSDFTDITAIGAPQVWLEFLFSSDSSGQREGTYLDNVVVTKGASTCTYSIDPTSQSFPASGGTGTVTVTPSSSGCGAWTATSNVAWATITSGASGTGDGSVGFSVASNTGAARSGTLTIAGQTFTVNQDACEDCGGGTVTIFSDDFEGAFPGPWQLYYGSGTESTTVWGKSSFRKAGGSYSLWCAGGGSNARPPGSSYVPNMYVWLEYGPFDLSDATDATLDFDLWSDVEAGSDSSYPDQIGLYVSTDDFTTNGSGYYYYNTGQQWAHRTLRFSDLTDVPSIGSNTVYVTFIFSSNNATQYEGSYIDNVVIQKTTNPQTCTYSLDPTSQSFPASGGTGSVTVTASSSGCGAWTATSNAGWITITSGASGEASGSVEYSVANNAGSARSGTLTIAGQTFTVDQEPAYEYSYWLPVISHTSGAGGTQWRSDVGVLDRSSTAASMELRLYAPGGTASATQTVPANGQAVFVDLAAQLGMTSGSGALEVRSTQPLIVTSRTYNLQSSGWTYGQGYDGLATSETLGAGDTAYLPQLAQTGVANQIGTYRANIGITNTGSDTASVTMTIFAADGTQLWFDTRSYAPGQFYQYQEPFRTLAGRTNIVAGYATVTVNSGSGVIAYASVIDNGSGDPMTMTMKR
jgi:hypothetical protein